MDRNLKFYCHVNYLRRKIFIKLRTVGRVGQYISQSLTKTLYKSLILLDFDYGDQLYDAMSVTDANQLQTLHNSCLRICTKMSPRIPIEELHRHADIPTLKSRRCSHCCHLVFKGVHNISSKGVNCMFEPVSTRNGHDTRTSLGNARQVHNCTLGISRGNLRVREVRYGNASAIQYIQNNCQKTCTVLQASKLI